jgi:hypothetical protein
MVDLVTGPALRFPVSDRRLAVIAGAGISLDSPSNLLDGWTFMLEVLRRAAPPDVPWKWVRAGLERPNRGLSRPGQFLRFELAMKALIDSGLDPELTVLECLAACTSPNRNHRLLAALARSGVVILTTNFDDLIERAYGDLPDAPPLRVAVFDDEFPDVGAIANGPSLWKLHGSFRRGTEDARASMRATMASVLALSKSSRRHEFLASVLRTMDVLVVGYSGWDDFDIIPVITRTPSLQRLTWTTHEDGDRFECRDSRAARAELSATWDVDAVGIDRVLLNLDADGAPLRDPANVLQLFAPTNRVLEQLCAARGVSLADPPTLPKTYRFGRRFPRETTEFFVTWAKPFDGISWRRHAFLRSAFELRIEEPRAKAIRRRVSAGSLPEITPDTSPADQLEFLRRDFNHQHVTFPPDDQQRDHLERTARILMSLREQVAPSEDVLALRLLACVGYFLGYVAESDLYFARSAVLARRERLPEREIATLVLWRSYFRRRLSDGNYARGFASDEAIAFSEKNTGLSVLSELQLPVADAEVARPFPAYPEAGVDRRITELEEESGYLPLVARDELQEPLVQVVETDTYDLDELADRLRRVRRHAVDVGDVLGEAVCSVRLAHVMDAVDEGNRAGQRFRTVPTEVVPGIGEVQRSLIEIVRVRELERLLGHQVRDPLMSSMFWDARAAAHPELQSIIRRSMWGVRGSRSGQSAQARVTRLMELVRSRIP